MSVKIWNPFWNLNLILQKLVRETRVKKKMSVAMILKSLFSKREINYPPISLNSFSSKVNLFISSKNGMKGKILFLSIVFINIVKYLAQVSSISLESSFTINPAEAIYYCIKIFILALFHFEYNQNFLDQIITQFRKIDIDYDQKTRKYYWTHRTIYRILITLGYLPRVYYSIVIYKYSWPYQSDEKKPKLYSILAIKLNDDPFNYWTSIVTTILSILLGIFHDFAVIDLAVLTQSALNYINNQVTIISKQMTLNGSRLDYKIVKTLRWQHFLVYRLVDKVSSLMNFCTFGLISYYMTFVIFCIYTLTFDDHILPIKISTIVQTVGIIIGLCLITHSFVTIFTRSQESLATLYKLSFETESFRVLNEVRIDE